MDLELKGRRVLITGGSKGIGLATAKAFLDEGASVIITARREDVLQDAAAALNAGQRLSTFAADLSQKSERLRLAAAFPDIDILVNNAGAIPGGSLFDLDIETWEAAWSLKVVGYIHLTQLYLRPMKEKGAGVIVNVIGSAGRSPRHDYVCGGVGNAALMAFTGAVGGQSPEFGVRVFAINPSQTRTDRIITLSKARAKTTLGDEGRWEEMLANLPFGRLAEPEEMAATIVCLASPKCGYVSGATLDVDGGQAFRKG